MTDEERMGELFVLRLHKLIEMHDALDKDDGSFKRLEQEYDQLEQEYRKLFDKVHGLDPLSRVLRYNIDR